MWLWIFIILLLSYIYIKGLECHAIAIDHKVYNKVIALKLTMLIDNIIVLYLDYIIPGNSLVLSRSCACIRAYRLIKQNFHNDFEHNIG